MQKITEALEQLNNKKAIVPPLLDRGLVNSKPLVRTYVQSLLDTLGVTQKRLSNRYLKALRFNDPILDDRDFWDDAALVFVGNKEFRSVRYFINKGLSHDDWYIRELAAKALGDLGDHRAAEPLEERIEDPEEDIFVIRTAIESLGKMSDPEAVNEDVLINKLEHDDWLVREFSAVSLGQLKKINAIEALTIAYRSEKKKKTDKRVRNAMNEALKALEGLVLNSPHLLTGTVLSSPVVTKIAEIEKMLRDPELKWIKKEGGILGKFVDRLIADRELTSGELKLFVQILNEAFAEVQDLILSAEKEETKRMLSRKKGSLSRNITALKVHIEEKEVDVQIRLDQIVYMVKEKLFDSQQLSTLYEKITEMAQKMAFKDIEGKRIDRFNKLSGYAARYILFDQGDPTIGRLIRDGTYDPARGRYEIVKSPELIKALKNKLKEELDDIIEQIEKLKQINLSNEERKKVHDRLGVVMTNFMEAVIALQKDDLPSGSSEALSSPVKTGDVGGIDLNQIEVGRQGAGVHIEFDPVEIQQIIDMGIDGFAPVIINIVPLPSVLPLLGLEPRKEEEFEISRK